MNEEIELNALADDIETTNQQQYPTKAEKFIQQLNAQNAKKVAFALVIGFVAYHGILNWQYG